MNNASKSKKQAQNAIIRQVRHLLRVNFYSVEKLRLLSLNKAIKIIRLIAKTEKTKLSKEEAHEVLAFLFKPKFSSTIANGVKKFFIFVNKYVSVFEKSLIVVWLKKFLSFVFNFRIMMQKVLRL